MIIAGAGGAAHLPGMTAALTPLPVFGVPVESKALSGQDTLLSIVQMPAGIPVGTLAIGKAGAINAALLAAAVLALSDAALAERLDAWRASADRRGRRAPVGRRHDGAAAARLDDRHHRRRPARPHAGDGRRPARLPHRHPRAAGRLPGGQVANRQIVAAYDDPAALAELARSCDVVTYEFENVPVAAADALAEQRAGLSAAAGAGGGAGPAGREALPQRGRHIRPPLFLPSTTTPTSPRRCSRSAATAC